MFVFGKDRKHCEKKKMLVTNIYFSNIVFEGCLRGLGKSNSSLQLFNSAYCLIQLIQPEYKIELYQDQSSLGGSNLSNSVNYYIF